MAIDLLQRRSGVVLHPTSLPGPHGIGDLGDAAHAFVDWLADAGQTVWQTLPLNPIGPGHSPYQCPSAFAGCALMVALEPLARAGWLPAAALRDVPAFDSARVDHAAVIPWRWTRLREAAAGFEAHATAADRAHFDAWCATQADWLPAWTLFAALKDAHDGQPWWRWSDALARREPGALAAAAASLAPARRLHAFVQWCFDRQHAALRAHAQSRGVLLMGDLPIFVAHDSADVWLRPDLFFIDPVSHQPTVVAGVPPDSYTPDGQRWGNPLYRWDRMAAEGYAWWIGRVRRAFEQAHILRIDHFRGFAGCWEVPADCPTARDGRWTPGPGAPLFEAIEAALGRLPIVAEDLGTITPDVIALRERFGYPGMRIVYEGLIYGPDHPFLPHHHVPELLAYTSTHDSDTVRGWWRSASPAGRALAATLLDLDAQDTEALVHQAVVRATFGSVAALALAPMQDLLGLGSEHRMNRPGTGSGNWNWRFDWYAVPPQLAGDLAALAWASGRAVSAPPGRLQSA